MPNPQKENPKPTTTHLHTLNVVVALMAGLVSIFGGIYSLKTNLNPAPKFGNVRGIVRDQVLAKPLWLAAVEISDAGGTLVDSGETDKTGSYSFGNLKEADYVIKVSAVRHIPESKNVKIERDKTSTINFDIIPVKEEPVAPVSESSQSTAFSPSGYGAQRSAVIPANTVTTQPIATQYQNSGGQVNNYTQAPVAAYQQTQGTGYPVRPPRRHGNRPPPPGGGMPPGYSGGGSSSNQTSSLNNLLMQAGGQLIQNWSSSNSSSGSQTQTGSSSQDSAQIETTTSSD